MLENYKKNVTSFAANSGQALEVDSFRSNPVRHNPQIPEQWLSDCRIDASLDTYCAGRPTTHDYVNQHNYPWATFTTGSADADQRTLQPPDATCPRARHHGEADKPPRCGTAVKRHYC